MSTVYHYTIVFFRAGLAIGLKDRRLVQGLEFWGAAPKIMLNIRLRVYLYLYKFAIRGNTSLIHMT